MPGTRGKVVIVDDEPDVLESTAMMVAALGYTPITIDDPSEVVDRVEQEQPGLILQDLRMPGLNLAGLVAALRLNPRTAEVPLAFFSAHTDVASTANRHGAWGYLSKPFSPEELQQLLERAFAVEQGAYVIKTEDIYRDMRAMFHEQWNLLSALNNYVSVMHHAKGADTARTLARMEEVLLKLEARTDRLQSYALAMAAAMEPVDAKPAAQEGRRHPRMQRPQRAADPRA